MAFDDRYNDHGLLFGWVAVSIGIGWPLSTDLGWFGVWRLAGIGLAAAGVAVLVLVCAAFNWIVEWWMFRKL